MKITSLIVASVTLACWIPSSQAATIDQTFYNPSNAELWNDSVLWGGNAVTSGNSYSTVAGLTNSPAPHSYTIAGISWDWLGVVRDTSGSAPATTTFLGDSLILNSMTRIIMKGRNNTVSTANIVMNGGHIILAPDSGGAGPTGTTNLSGSIDVTAPLAAIGVYGSPSGANTLNINSTITGTGLLQLTSYGTTRSGTLNITGDYSAFAGTFFVAVASDQVPTLGVFSFAAGVAPMATLSLDTTGASFSFSLDSSLTFGTVIVDGDALSAGTYDYATLDAMAPGKFLDGGGSITVIPEPSTTLLLSGALACALVFLRHRKSAGDDTISS